MPDADKSLKLHVEMDVSGREEVQAANNVLAATTEAAKKAAEDSAGLAGAKAGGAGAAAAAKEDSDAMKLLLEQVNKIIPGLGETIEASFAGRLAPVILSAMAVRELIERIGQMDEALEKVQLKSRETFAGVVKDAETAGDTINKSTKSIDDFFSTLDRKTGQKDVENGFAAGLQRIRDTGDAAVNNGLADREQVDDFVNSRTRQARLKRAGGLDVSIKSLSEQRDQLKAAGGGDEAKEKEEELIDLRREQAGLYEAFIKGEMFRPTSVARNSIGVLPDDTLKSPDVEVARKTDYVKMEAELNRQITLREEGKTKLEEHINLLEEAIERMTTESQALKAGVNQADVTTVTQDFARGKSVADNALRTGSINASDASYIATLEQAINGHKLTLQQAITLIQAQSKNLDTATQILEMHQDQIGAVDAKLKELQERVKNSRNYTTGS